MNCQQARSYVENWNDNLLNGVDRIRLELHFSRCSACRAWFEAERKEHILFFKALNDPKFQPELPPGLADRVAATVTHRHPSPWKSAFGSWLRRAAVLAVLCGGAAFAAWLTVATSVPAERDLVSSGEQEKKTEVKKVQVSKRTVVALAATSLALWTSAEAKSPLALSNVIRLNANPDETIHWRTGGLESTDALSLDWPAGAVCAELTVSNACSIGHWRIDDTSVSEFAVNPVVLPEDEHVSDFYLTFFDGNGICLKRQVARIGFVNRLVSRYIAPDETSASKIKWRRLAERQVFPVPDGEVVLALDGQPVETGLDGHSGWFMWAPVDFGSHRAELTVGSTCLAASDLLRRPDPFVLMLR